MKFRAWDKKNNKMIYSYRFKTLSSFFTKVEGLNIMRFTGLKDKKGKKIYEGDFIKKLIEDKFYQSVNGKFTIKKVVYRAPNFLLDYYMSEKGSVMPEGWTTCTLIKSINMDLSKEMFFSDSYFERINIKDFEIVGNMYENDLKNDFNERKK